MLVSYTSRGRDNPQPRKYTVPRIQRNNYGGIAHIPQEGSPWTICGARIFETIDVPEDAEIRTCKVCQSRLEAVARKNPERLTGMLGNPQLPAPII